MPAQVVFFDIAGPDAKALGAFYSKVFGWDISPAGQFNLQATDPLEATIRQDPRRSASTSAWTT